MMSKINLKKIKSSKLKVWREDHAVSKIGIHLVWCTKRREPFLIGDVKITVKNVIEKVCSIYKWGCRNIEIFPDYIHVLVQIHPNNSSAMVSKVLKTRVATEIVCKYPELRLISHEGKGLWANSTYYGSIGEASEEMILKYVDTKKYDYEPFYFNCQESYN